MQATGKSGAGRVPCSPNVARLAADGKLEVETPQGRFVPKTDWSRGVDAWRSLVESAAAKHQIAPAIVAAIMNIESGGDPSAVSPAGALGLMQLMPETYNWLAGKPKGTPVDRTDAMRPEVNVDLGAKLLARNMRSYAGNLIDASVAYNAGTPRCGECKCWSSKGCKPDAWGAATDCGYVEKVIGAYNAAVERNYAWRVPSRFEQVLASAPSNNTVAWAAFALVGLGIGAVVSAVATR